MTGTWKLNPWSACLVEILYQETVFLLSTEKRSVEDDELPEVDQNTKKSLRSRAATTKSK